jgi:hypothetical protein
LGVINWTGPSVWTDAVLTYLKARYGVTWTDLRGLRRPVRVGDTVILPVTGFSPGVGNFGAGTVHGEYLVRLLCYFSYGEGSIGQRSRWD